MDEFNNNPTGDAADEDKRERKIAIFSNNMDSQCDDGRSICDVYRDRIYGVDSGEGIGVIMINIDFPDSVPDDLYERCITYNDPDRIIDVTTGELNEPDDRDLIVEETIKVKLCENEPSPSPTTDPTNDPTSSWTEIDRLDRDSPWYEQSMAYFV